jgi:rRNA small subunit pseudouridine methyltransferase Nep1
MVDEEKHCPIIRPTLTLVLVDSEIELVPKKYWSHPAVVVNAKKRKKRPSMVLLDSSLHHSLFKDNDQKNRRGRPDIVHQYLLLSLDSILNAEGRLEIYVHTRNDQLIVIDRSTRLPKNYNRYSGLFEELFHTGTVPTGRDPLIRLIEDMDLPSSLRYIRSKKGGDDRPTRTVLLHPDGEPMNTWELFGKLILNEGIENIICLVGGFSHGDFRSAVEENSDMKLSLPGGTLKVWTVISELLVGFRGIGS